MVKLKYTFFALIGLTLVSCVAPKAIVVEQPAVPKKEKAPEPVVSEPPLPTLPEDGLRAPNMLDLPSEGDLRSAGPSATRPEAGSVISRPPTDPPSRGKPKEVPADQR